MSRSSFVSNRLQRSIPGVFGGSIVAIKLRGVVDLVVLAEWAKEQAAPRY